MRGTYERQTGNLAGKKFQSSIRRKSNDRIVLFSCLRINAWMLCLIVTGIFSSGGISLKAQDTSEGHVSFRSERAMFKQAERYFVSKDYARALPLYEQLVKKHSDNYKLNYGYGICLLIMDKDKALAVSYLEKAAKSILVWDDVWYYLGRGYQLNGEFDKSKSAYDQFLKMVSPSQALRWEAMHQIEMCNNAIKFTAIPDTSVALIPGLPVSFHNFYEQYHFKNDSRKITDIPDEFLTEGDKRSNLPLLAFISADGTRMVFASHGREGEIHTDIYLSELKTGGKWGKPQRLNATVNSAYDEALPALSEDGLTMYYSSKGHNSMGGFDIFRTTYYPQTRQWSKPENMGVPVNSPDDDYYFVSSDKENIAYYSSRRGNDFGYISVYQSAIHSISEEGLLVNGELINEYAAPYRKALITVTRISDGAVVAEVNSDGVNGKYSYTLPMADQYRIQVRVEGFGPLSQSVSFSKEVKGRISQICRVSKDSLGYDHLSVTYSFEEAGDKGAMTASDLKSGEEQSAFQDTLQHVSAGSVNETAANQKLSTGFEPITMYSVTGLPPVSEASKSKLREYFEDINKNSMEREDKGLINLNTSKEKGISYRVQMGTFMVQTPEQVYAKLKEMGFEDVSFYTNKKGWNIFYTGQSKDIGKTLRLKDIVVNYGFEDAFITVFENGRPSRAGKK